MMSRIGLALACLAAISTASAATVDCTPQNQNTVSSGVLTPIISFNCAGVTATPGNVIQSVSIDIFVSFNDAVVGGTHQIQSTATLNSPEIQGSASTTVSTTVGPFIGFGATSGYFAGTFSPNAATVTGLASLAAFTISVQSVSLGDSLPNNASISVAYTTTEVPAGSVPEPTSLILLGSGFLGLGLSSRLRKGLRHQA